MDKDIITKISSIEMRLENSLEAEDFISVSKLSIDLDQLIKELTRDIEVKKLTEIERRIRRLLLSLIILKTNSEKFKNYTFKVSQQTKMHQHINNNVINSLFRYPILLHFLINVLQSFKARRLG